MDYRAKAWARTLLGQLVTSEIRKKDTLYRGAQADSICTISSGVKTLLSTYPQIKALILLKIAL